MSVLKVMVTKGLRGRENPEEYHKHCIEAVTEHLQGQAYEILEAMPVSNSFNGDRVKCLCHTLTEELANADVIVFMDDWHNFDGCVVEHVIAQRYGIPIVYLSSNQ